MGRPGQPKLWFTGIKPGGLLHGGKKAKTHAVEPGIGPTIPLQKEEAFREPDEPIEPVEN